MIVAVTADTDEWLTQLPKNFDALHPLHILDNIGGWDDTVSIFASTLIFASA